MCAGWLHGTKQVSLRAYWLPLPPTPTPSGTANFLRQKKKMQTNEMKCAFSQEKKLTEVLVLAHQERRELMCVVAAVGVCVCGGGHKCLVQEQEEHVCFPLNATTYRNIRLDKLFTS